MIVVRSIPFYWGIETHAPDPSLITKSWLVEDIIPFRESIWAFRIRVSHKHWLHVGRFRYRREALHSGLVFKPTEIGKWGSHVVPEDPDDAWAAWSDEVRSDEAGGSGDCTGVDPVSDGGTVPRDAAPGTGPALAGEADADGDRSGVADHSGVTAQG